MRNLPMREYEGDITQTAVAHSLFWLVCVFSTSRARHRLACRTLCGLVAGTADTFAGTGFTHVRGVGSEVAPGCGETPAS